MTGALQQVQFRPDKIALSKDKMLINHVFKDSQLILIILCILSKLLLCFT